MAQRLEPTVIRYIDFADVVGTYKQVVNLCESLPTGHLIREDGFTRRGVEIHRVYVTDKSISERVQTWKSYSSFG